MDFNNFTLRKERIPIYYTKRIKTQALIHKNRIKFYNV